MRLQGHARPGDTVARLGGDEFGVLLEDVAEAEAVRSAEALLEGLATPIVLRDRDLTRPPASASPSPPARTPKPCCARRHRHVAAKRQGKSRYALFEPAMHATVLEQLDLAADLSRAVEKGQLHLCYEPQISLTSGQICCLEALVRWRHPTRGEVPPGEFIPLAEEAGMILPIGHWVLREACRQVKAWQERRSTAAPLTIAVNLSARQLQPPGIVDEVHAALAAAGLDPRSLVLEITKTAIMEQLDAAIAILTELRRLGVRLALDDFGTGYSSLSYLQRLPVDIPQDRPLLCRRRGQEHRGLRPRPGDPHPRSDARSGDGRRRHRDSRTAGRPARARLPARPGLLLRQAPRPRSR